jgi:hypothetical protein
MSYIQNRRVLASIILLAFAAALPLHAQPSTALPTAPDSTLYTTYSLFTSGGQTTVEWVVCGSTQETEGCYDAGSLGPFVAVGAMLESSAVAKGDIVTREVYIVDSGDASDVRLYVYKKTDVVTSDFDTTTITLLHIVPLPLTGGATALVSMAANNKFLFIGTNQSPQGIEVAKNTLTITTLGGFSPPINVTAITADQYGYVTVTQGNADGNSAFTVLGPDGFEEEDGGGSDFMLGTMQAVIPTPALGGTLPHAPRRDVRPKASTPDAH